MDDSDIAPGHHFPELQVIAENAPERRKSAVLARAARIPARRVRDAQMRPDFLDVTFDSAQSGSIGMNQQNLRHVAGFRLNNG